MLVAGPGSGPSAPGKPSVGGEISQAASMGQMG
ncbi:MAG: hypothetical protein Ct9H300mP15_23440 [Gemmatimonadota bacterium]|nr:MAG: hypothetical protein Ct9H300mP15_23440 [Gemmatimonadota bacterium]